MLPTKKAVRFGIIIKNSIIKEKQEERNVPTKMVVIAARLKHYSKGQQPTGYEGKRNKKRGGKGKRHQRDNSQHTMLPTKKALRFGIIMILKHH